VLLVVVILIVIAHVMIAPWTTVVPVGTAIVTGRQAKGGRDQANDQG
jgi:hypothetical protein